METIQTNAILLKRNVFDIRNIGHLRRVSYYREMVSGKKYAAVPGYNDGIPKHAWITVFEFIRLLDEHSIMGKCTIMDGNYTFTRIFTDKDYIVYDL